MLVLLVKDRGWPYFGINDEIYGLDSAYAWKEADHVSLTLAC